MQKIAVTMSAVALVAGLALAGGAMAQTKDKGPWWPSPYGPTDQAGNSNLITPQTVLQALKIPKTGKIYELGHIYDDKMPQFGDRPYFINVPPTPDPKKAGEPKVHRDYFTGYIGQMGTQFDAFGHQGVSVRMADGSVKSTYYNGFTEDDLTGANRGVGGLEALGVEHAGPIITRGVLVDIAGYKGVPVLDSRYEITVADIQGALAKQGVREDSIQPGDAILINTGWVVNWTNPSKYNDSYFGKGQNNGSPGIGGAAAHWLVDKKVSMVGADNCCVQVMPPLKPTDENVHHVLLLHGVYLLENMDLTELAKDRVYDFLYLNLTERIRGATGSPVRPIAMK